MQVAKVEEALTLEEEVVLLRQENQLLRQQLELYKQAMPSLVSLSSPVSPHLCKLRNGAVAAVGGPVRCQLEGEVPHAAPENASPPRSTGQLGTDPHPPAPAGFLNSYFGPDTGPSRAHGEP
jgi:hypothetical protein